MAEYGAYTGGDDDHFLGFQEMVCRDDGEAIAKCQKAYGRSPHRGLERRTSSYPAFKELKINSTRSSVSSMTIAISLATLCRP